MGLRHLAAALALVTAFPAAAQVELTPDTVDPNAVLVEELIVTARDAGPAWWIVSDADTTVYVLGTPSLAPKRMQWDRSVFDRRLKGANVVILPFGNVKAKTGGAIGSAFNYMRLKSSTSFEDTLDPPDRARFAAAREKIGAPAKKFETKNALAAGILLATEYRDRSQLTNSDPTKLIRYLAGQAKVPMVDKSYDIGPQLGAMIRTPRAVGLACAMEVVQQVEAGPGVTLQAARAWADGDVRGALQNERTYETCLALAPGGRAYDARTKADAVAAIEKALQTPGHAIAVVWLRPLLAQGGVLDQLRAAGFTVKTPGDEE